VGRIHENEKEKKAGSALLTLLITCIPQQKANNIERNTFPKFFSQCASIVKSKPMAAR
jgi:hypothetical protein